MKKKALRALADLALATGDIDAANGYFKQYIDLEPKNAQLWIELGDALLAGWASRDVALESYRAAEKLLGSDPAKRVEVVARRGQALEGKGNDDEAIAEYRRAIKLAPKGYYLEVELTARIIDIYRHKQALPALLASTRRSGRGLARPLRVGHARPGSTRRPARRTRRSPRTRRRSAKAPWELETQRRLIALLENVGRDDEALAQYEAVVAGRPGEARFQLELAERYWRRGEAKKALDALRRLETRFPGDAGVQSAIADSTALGQGRPRPRRLRAPGPASSPTSPATWSTSASSTSSAATRPRRSRSGSASPTPRPPPPTPSSARSSPSTACRPTPSPTTRKAIKLEPKNPELYKGRAQVHEGSKAYADALADWENVLDRSWPQARRPPPAATPAAASSRSSPAGAARRASTATLAPRLPQDAARPRGRLLPRRVLRPAAADGEPSGTLEKLRGWSPTTRTRSPIWSRRTAPRASTTRRSPCCSSSRSSTGAASARSTPRSPRSRPRPARTTRPSSGCARRSPRARTIRSRTSGSPSATSRCSASPTRSPPTRRPSLDRAQLQGALRAGPALRAERPRDGRRRAVPRHPAPRLDEDVLARAGREAIDLEEMTQTLGELEKVVAPLSFTMAHKPVYRRILVDLYLRYVPQAGRARAARHRREEGGARRARAPRRPRPQAAARGAPRREGRQPAAGRRRGARPPRQQGRRRAAGPPGARSRRPTTPSAASAR